MTSADRPPGRREGPLRRAALAIACVLACLAAPAASAQSDPVVVRSEGGNTAFPDDEHSDRIVWVFFGGVDVAQGDLRLRGDTLVAVLRRSAEPGDESRIGPGESLLPGSRIVELLVHGDVTMEQGSERILGAQSIYIDNESGTLTSLEGTWRSTLSGTPLIVHYQVMRKLADGIREMEGVSYTTCDFAHAHWSLDTPWTRLVPTDEGDVLHTSWNTAQIGGLPFLWMPALHLNVDKDQPPLRSLGFGSSRRLGTEVRTRWGGDASGFLTGVNEAFGPGGAVDGQWELQLNNYSSRGLFYEPKWTYRTERSRGEFFGSYIHDRNRYDELGQPIFDDTRGRVDLEHRTEFDEHRTLDVELSYISDGEYLHEYYEQEDRIGKQQETYASYRDVRDNEAYTALVRGRLNNYQTQNEYLPRLEHRWSGEPVDTGPFGTAYFSTVDFVDVATLRAETVYPRGFAEDGFPQDPRQPDSQRNIRAGTRGMLEWPVDVAGDRVSFTAGYDITGFDRNQRTPDDPDTNADESEIDPGGFVRYGLLGGVEWMRTYSGSDSDFHSDVWNMDGVRQILEPRVGYQSVFELNHGPEDLIEIDQTEELRKQHAFLVGLRHRVQTHQNKRVVTTLDTDVSIPFFPNEDRDNLQEIEPEAPDDLDGQTAGLLTLDTRWRPGADVFGLRTGALRWRTRYDPDGWKNVDSFAAYSANLGEDQRFQIAHNRSRDISDFLTAGVQWNLTPRWTLAAYNQQDLLEGENARRGVILRQQAHRWLIDIEVSRRRGESRVGANTPGAPSDNSDTRFTIRLQPSFVTQDETLLDRLGRIR